MSRTNWNFARARQNAWGAAELPPSGTSGPTPPTPAPARFARALVLGADHRARPSVARGGRAGGRCRGFGNPFGVSITILLARQRQRAECGLFDEARRCRHRPE